jgi:hypothetical protein
LLTWSKGSSTKSNERLSGAKSPTKSNDCLHGVKSPIKLNEYLPEAKIPLLNQMIAYLE